MGPHCARGRFVTGMVYYSSPIAGLSPAVNDRHSFIYLGVERQSRAKLLVQGNKATAMREPRTPDLKLEVLTLGYPNPTRFYPFLAVLFFFKEGWNCISYGLNFPNCFFVAKLGGVEKGPSNSQSCTTFPRPHPLHSIIIIIIIKL